MGGPNCLCFLRVWWAGVWTEILGVWTEMWTEMFGGVDRNLFRTASGGTSIGT